MFEFVERHKRTKEEIKVILLEFLAAMAVLAVVGVVVWMVFFRSEG